MFNLVQSGRQLDTRNGFDHDQLRNASNKFALVALQMSNKMPFDAVWATWVMGLVVKLLYLRIQQVTVGHKANWDLCSSHSFHRTGGDRAQTDDKLGTAV